MWSNERNWFLKNWGNVFGVLGLLATLWIGIFYVPSYVKDSLSEKERTIHNDLIQATKELIYSDTIITLKEVETLIKAKEIKYQISYRYNTGELLLHVHESFMEHKFLPLENRKSLIKKIDYLRAQIKTEDINHSSERKNSTTSLLITISSILLTIIAVITGIRSFFYRAKRENERQEEITNELISTGNDKVNEEAWKYNTIRKLDHGLS